MEISKTVLHVGPAGKELKGGIKEVLNNYENIFGDNFNLFPTLFFQNKLFGFLLFPFLIFKFIFYLLINKQIKIIHFHTSSNGSFLRKSILFLLAKFFFSKKCIFQIHGGAFWDFYKKKTFLQSFISFIFKKADAIIFLVEKQRVLFSTNFELKKTYIINNIVSGREYEERTIQNPIKFVFLGKIIKAKGIYDLIEVISANRSYLSGKIELIVGGNGEEQKLINIIKKEKLQNIVQYIGWVSGDEKVAIYKASNILILPSYVEAMPMSILEAMSFSMPIISTRVGSVPDLVEDHVNGILINKKNRIEIFEAIDFYIKNKDAIVTHGKKSHQRSIHYFPEKFIDSITKIYRDL